MAAATRTLALAAAALGSCLALAGAAPAAGAPVAGAIHLTVVADAAAMAAMSPGTPVAWDVGVATDTNHPGTITATLQAATAFDGQFTREVRTCTRAWTPTGCPGTLAVLRPAAPVVVDPGDALVSFPAADGLWFRVLVEMVPGAAPDARATFTLRADGVGDSVSTTTPGGGALAGTGADVRRSGLLAVGAVAVGLLLAGLARRRRNEAPAGDDR